MNTKSLIGWLNSIAGEFELKAFESGDFDSEEDYMERANILREAADRLGELDD